MHVESGAWVSERKDVLYTLFFLLALVKSWDYLVSGKKINYWVCFLFFILSILSKPAAIVLPLILILLGYWNDRSIPGKVLFEKLPFLIVSLVMALITLNIQSGFAVVKLIHIPYGTDLLSDHILF